MILAALWWFGVTTKVLGRDKGVSMGRAEAGRDIDLRSRPGLLKLGVTIWALGRDGGRHSCLRDLLVVRAAAPTTWALRAQFARDLGFGCAHCAPNPVLIQCTIWTLFMDTVHEHCSQGKKKSTKLFKIFLCMI